ncbi:MAG: M64 family metallopeptidase [archaeon]|jgi:hypothetical protein|nr:M64 family metallopeptidase [archaeon]
MKKAAFISVVSVLILVIIAGAVIHFKTKPSLSPESNALESCKSIYYNGEGKTNIVIFSSDKTAKTYADKLLSYSPFSENKEAFNFYYIDSYQPECEMYLGIALLCYSRELIKKASSCPSDYIFVVKDADIKVRSSAYMNVISLNSRLPSSVIVHEFAHVFANLADEYVPSQIPDSSENCAPDCSRFGENCFSGCGEDRYYRSIDSGIMKTLNSKTLGAFNEDLIVQMIIKPSNALAGKAIYGPVDCRREEYYLIEGNFSNGEIEFISKTIEQGCIGSNGIGSFNYDITLSDNSAHSGSFNAELIFTDSQAEAEDSITGGAVANEGIFLLKIPIIENAKSLELSTQTSSLEISLENKGDHPCEIE